MGKAKEVKLIDIAGADFIGGRYVGEVVRQEIEEAINANSTIVIDFSGIKGVTQSFADEAIGILIRAFGIQTVKNHVKVKNANDKIRLVLNWVASYSKKYAIPT